MSRDTALRVLLAIPLPALAVPRVLGIDDFALRRGRIYATVLIDAGTGRRVDVIPGRTADITGQWLRDHPGAEVVCRDGPGADGEAVRQALPGAVQVSDRWHRCGQPLPDGSWLSVANGTREAHRRNMRNAKVTGDLFHGQVPAGAVYVAARSRAKPSSVSTATRHRPSFPAFTRSTMPPAPAARSVGKARLR